MGLTHDHRGLGYWPGALSVDLPCSGKAGPEGRGHLSPSHTPLRSMHEYAHLSSLTSLFFFFYRPYKVLLAKVKHRIERCATVCVTVPIAPVMDVPTEFERA